MHDVGKLAYLDVFTEPFERKRMMKINILASVYQQTGMSRDSEELEVLRTF